MSSAEPEHPDLDPTGVGTPSPGELDVLAVLWEQQLRDPRPLKLSEVHRLVSERRRSNHEPEPALTTVSTHLRSLTAKKLIRETYASEGSPRRQRVQTRGILTPATRSPLTGYLAIHSASEVLFKTMQALAGCYPASQRLQALRDIARAVHLSPDGTRKLDAIVAAEESRRRSGTSGEPGQDQGAATG